MFFILKIIAIKMHFLYVYLFIVVHFANIAYGQWWV